MTVSKEKPPKDWEYLEWHRYALQLPVNWVIGTQTNNVTYRARTNRYMAPTIMFSLSYAPEKGLSEQDNNPLYTRYLHYKDLVIRDNPNL